MLAYQKFANYLLIFFSICAKIVKCRILFQFLCISCNYTYFLANKSTTLDNFGIYWVLQTNAFSMAQDFGFSASKIIGE